MDCPYQRTRLGWVSRSTLNSTVSEVIRGIYRGLKPLCSVHVLLCSCSARAARAGAVSGRGLKARGGGKLRPARQKSARRSERSDSREPETGRASAAGGWLRVGGRLEWNAEVGETVEKEGRGRGGAWERTVSGPHLGKV